MLLFNQELEVDFEKSAWLRGYRRVETVQSGKVIRYTFGIPPLKSSDSSTFTFPDIPSRNVKVEEYVDF